MPAQLLQITDTHLFADRDQALLGVPTLASLQLVVADANKRFADADACLLTGDLSQDATVASYRHLAECFEPLAMPKYALPGNHDDTNLMCAELEPAGISCSGEFESAGWYMILLNTVASGDGHHGELSDKELRRLDAALAAHKNFPCLVAVHHHPVQLHSAWIDTLGLHDSDTFFATLDRHPQVRLVIWGHAHQEYTGRHNGITLLGAPSTCVQFRPNAVRFEADQLYPGYRVITLQENGEFESQVYRIDTFPFEVDVNRDGYK